MLLANARFLAGYRYPGRVDADLVTAVTDRRDATVSIGELAIARLDTGDIFSQPGTKNFHAN